MLRKVHLANFLHFLQILEIKCFLQESQATTAAQPVGFTAGLKGAEERIQNFRQQGNIADDIPVVSLEGFIIETIPDR